MKETCDKSCRRPVNSLRHYIFLLKPLPYMFLHVVFFNKITYGSWPLTTIYSCLTPTATRGLLLIICHLLRHIARPVLTKRLFEEVFQSATRFWKFIKAFDQQNCKLDDYTLKYEVRYWVKYQQDNSKARGKTYLREQDMNKDNCIASLETKSGQCYY